MNKAVPAIVVVLILGVAAYFLFLKPEQPVTEKASYEVMELKVYPEDTPVGSKVYVTAKVKALKTGWIDVSISIGGEELTKSVEVENAGQVLLVDFEYIPMQAGSFEVVAPEVAPISFSVHEPTPPSFKVTKIDIPSRAIVGKEVVACIEVVNEGEMEGSYSGVLHIGAQDIHQRYPVTIGPKATRMISFRFTPTEAGKFDVTIENYVGSPVKITVEESRPEFSIEDLMVPSFAYVGEAQATVVVKNVGNDTGQYKPEILVDGERITYPRAESIAPGEEKIFVFNLGELTTGSHTIKAGDYSRILQVSEKPEVFVKDISVPEVVIVGSSVPVRITIRNNGTSTQTFSEDLIASPGGTQTVTAEVAPGQEKIVDATVQATQKGIMYIEIGGKQKSVRVLGYKDLMLEDVDWLKYRFSSTNRIPELGQEYNFPESGTATVTVSYKGMVEIGGKKCRKVVSEIEGGEESYQIFYSPDTDTAAYLFALINYYQGSKTTEVEYDPPLQIASFPLEVGATSSSTSTMTVHNYYPIDITLSGQCTCQYEVVGTETVVVKGQPVEAFVVVVTIHLEGQATFRGEVCDVVSDTVITRRLNRVGILLKSEERTTSKVTYMGQQFTIISETNMELLDYSLTNLSQL